MMDWINPLVGWWGLGSVSLAGLAALAWFFPPLRKIAIIVGGVIIALLAAYTRGSRDASRRKQAQWDEAERRMARKGHQARADAERDLAAGRLSDDEFDRDARR